MSLIPNGFIEKSSEILSEVVAEIADTRIHVVDEALPEFFADMNTKVFPGVDIALDAEPALAPAVQEAVKPEIVVETVPAASSAEPESLASVTELAPAKPADSDAADLEAIRASVERARKNAA